jgi:4-hydroxybenzoate polyprenyltransferase
VIVKAVNYLTSSSVFLAINGSLVVVFGSILYRTPLTPQILTIAFLSVLSVYSLNNATDKKEDAINRPEAAKKSQKLYVFQSLFALALSLGIGATIGLTTILIILFPIIVGIFYSVRIFPSLPRLKEIVGAKSVLVALCWALSGAFLPIAQLHSWSGEQVVSVFFYIFIQMLINTILFDIIDLKGDVTWKIETIPAKIGVGSTRKLLLLMNSSLILWASYCQLRNLFTEYIMSVVFSLLYGYVVIWIFSHADRKRLAAEVIVDGEWIPILALTKAIVLIRR